MRHHQHAAGLEVHIITLTNLWTTNHKSSHRTPGFFSWHLYVLFRLFSAIYCRFRCARSEPRSERDVNRGTGSERDRQRKRWEGGRRGREKRKEGWVRRHRQTDRESLAPLTQAFSPEWSTRLVFINGYILTPCFWSPQTFTK